MKLDVVVLAGSPNKGLLKECSNAGNEALITIGKKHMVEYVVDALVSTSSINKIVVAGPQKELLEIFDSPIMVTEGGITAIETLRKGINILNTTNPVLVVCADIPLLTAAAVEDFVRLCKEREADFYYPIIPQEVIKTRFPDVNRTYVNLLEGVFTGGNILLIKPHILERSSQVAENVVKLRKKPVRLCQLLGFRILLRYFLGKLSITEIEEKVQELLDIKGAAVISKCPEIGVDVDKPSDLELVLGSLSKTA